MGNICASSRNKECLYTIKNPDIIKKSFTNCDMYKKTNSRKNLKKRKRRLKRRILIINCELERKNAHRGI